MQKHIEQTRQQIQNLEQAFRELGEEPRREPCEASIGLVREAQKDDQEWAIRYAVVDTRSWLPGKKVLVSERWIPEISWPKREVYVDLIRDEIRSAPEWGTPTRHWTGSTRPTSTSTTVAPILDLPLALFEKGEP